MPKFRFQPFFVILVAPLLFTPWASGQAASSGATAAPAADSTAAVTRGVQLAKSNHCKEALPALKGWPRVADKDLKREGGLATVRCAMAMSQEDAALNALIALRHAFPSDPDVLYVETHAYSDLSTHAASELATKAPDSYQAHELGAEAFEEQGKWDEAEAQYRTILQQNPTMPGMHFRIGRLILSRPPNATTPQDARVEFEAELKIDPNNAGAEYVLGELAASDQNWAEAIPHFSNAVKLDPTFTDALRGLGMAYNSNQQFDQAVAPLESYVKFVPDDPAGHYQLAIAYARTGKKDQATQQMALQRELDAKARKLHDGQDPNAPR